MPHVKSLPVPRDTYYDTVKEILRSTLEAVQAKYGVVSLIRNENGRLQNYVSYRSLPGRGAYISLIYWVATHGQPLALETQEEALAVPDLVINRREGLPLVCVPIQVNGTTIGALQSSFPSVIGHEELLQKQHFLELAADLIGYVIENATLQSQLWETKELLRNVNSISLEIQELERERIILEVHDGIAQTLASAFQYLQTLKKSGAQIWENVEDSQVKHSRQLFSKVTSLVRQAIQETREVINSITPATLDVLGLVTTVQQELKQFERETGCQVKFRLASWPNLPKHMEVAIYRIIHEAINNVRKHAKSPRLEVQMRQEQNRLVIRVKDWGIGFIPDKQEPPLSNRSLGLLSMRRRAEFLGGTFEINSSLGEGAEILVDIPWLRRDEYGENKGINCR